MPSGQTIITNALTALGINDQGGAPNASDSADALAELNVMWGAMGIDEGLIFAVQAATIATTIAGASYLWSIFSTAAPPSKIYTANWLNAAGQRFPLEVIPSERYRAHRDLAAAALAPEELYADFLIPAAAGTGSVFLWPVPSVVGTLDIEVGAIFAAWTLAGVYSLPQGYQDLIEKALAFRLIARFGDLITGDTAKVIQAVGSEAQMRIRKLNAAHRQLSAEAAGLQAPPPAAGPRAPVQQ